MVDNVREFRSMMRAAIAALACAWLAYGGTVLIQMRVERCEMVELIEDTSPYVEAKVLDTYPHPCRDGYTLYLVQERSAEHDAAPMTKTYMINSSGALAEYHNGVLDRCGYSIPVQAP
ncbi:MAG: hypothetical protein AAGI01_04050 [Myxococcota bacterium]